MKRLTWVVSLLILCVILTLAACEKPKDQLEESTLLPSSSSVPQTETKTTTDTEAASDIVPDSTSAESTAAPTGSEEAPSEATELPEPDTTVPQSSEQASEPAPSETAKPTEPKTTEPKAPEPTAPKPTEPAPTQPKPTEPAPPPTEPPHVHSWGDWKQTKAPTCAATGEEMRTCTGCGATESRSVSATGKHSWQETAPTCTQEGKKTCAVCGAKESIPALGHNWVHHEEEGHWQTLVTCYCGAQFSSSAEWEAHASASDDLAYLDAHAGYEAHEIWVVDSSAQDVCSRCGTIK